MFTIGEFDQRITLERLTTSANELNEPVGAWEEAMRAWARVRPVSQRDMVEADHPWSSGTYIFTIRRCGSFSAQDIMTMRIDWRGDLYEVIGEPLWLDGRRYLQIRASSWKGGDE